MSLDHDPTEADLAAEGADLRQFVTFTVGDGLYGVPIGHVREIRHWTPVTALPNQPAHTKGVLNLRGTIVPVHDVRAMFGATPRDPDENDVIVIVWVGTRAVGILTDAVSDIISVPETQIKPVPVAQAGTGAANGLVTCDQGMVALLDLNTLFRGTDDDA
ncbi:MAG: chemotaxis protein CheW [Pseudomonadota bacterium]